MKSEIRPLDGIRENEANPRQMQKDKFKRLVDSLLVFPKMLSIRPIVVDDSGVILGGNMRYRALLHIATLSLMDIEGRLAGLSDYNDKTEAERGDITAYWQAFLDRPAAPVINASELSDADRQAFIIKDNVGFGDWDWDRLANEWDSAKLDEWGLGVWKPDNVKNTDRKKTRAEILNDYDAFVEKFEPKKTTDDCYTPQYIYDVIKQWVSENIIPLDGVPIVRPFYPGGDYENFDYPDGCVVLDNPPFSILSKIRSFYQERGIRYFLFAPTLTLFSSIKGEETFIITDCGIIYENGAVVKTSFITNLTPSLRIWCSGPLTETIKDEQDVEHKNNCKELPVYEFPKNIYNAARLQYICKGDVELKIAPDECERINDRIAGFSIFGGGYIINDIKAKAEAEAEAKAKAEAEAKAKAEAEAEVKKVFELTTEAQAILDRLNGESA